LAVVLLIAINVILFSILPAIGYSAAKAHLHTWIVAAEYCAPLTNREDRLSRNSNRPEKSEDSSTMAKITPCLLLWKNGFVIAKGRHIVSTNSHIVLFDPESGEVRLEPIDGVFVRTGSIQPVL
jgi:hypothetical protein